MFGVESFGFGAVEPDHFSGSHFEALDFKAVDNLADNIFFNAVGFDNAQCLFHNDDSLCNIGRVFAQKRRQSKSSIERETKMFLKNFTGTLLVLLLGLFTSLSVLATPLILSHRGASYWAPEETRPSYLLASLLGGDYWEMDIQRTKDNVLIALHDLTLERTTNVAEIFPGREKDPVETFTWAELQKLDAGSWFNKKNSDRARDSYKGLKILSFEEVIDLALRSKYSGGLYVESKNPEHYAGMEQQMLDLLKKKKWLGPKNQMTHRLYFQTFGRDSAVIFKKIAPTIPCTLLIDDEHKETWPDDIKFGVEHQFVLGPPIALFDSPENKEAVLKSKARAHVWTIDEESQIQKAKDLNLDGIFTNRTDLAVFIYKKKAAPVGQYLKQLKY